MDLDKLLENLERMPEAVSAEVLKTMKVETQRIRGRAVNLAPVDTGHLRNTITAEAWQEPDGDVAGEVSVGANYGAYVELGTGPTGAASPKILPEGVNPAYKSQGWTYFSEKDKKFYKTNGQPARPFLYPAFRASRGTVSENIKKAAARGMKKGGDSDG